jgi:predicted NBD/HSP70 family sugar kinase
VDNDVNLAAIGEQRAGVAQGEPTLFSWQLEQELAQALC